MIDDEILSDDLLVRLLRLEGFAVHCATSGSVGVERALARRYDGILLDLRLPDTPGLDVLARLRDHGVPTPVVVITGWHLDDGQESAARGLGAVDLLRKPLDATALAGALRAVVGRDRTAMCPPAASSPECEATETTTGRPDADGGSDLQSLRGGVPAHGSQEHHRSDELVSRVLSALQRALRRAFPRASGDLVADAAEDAILVVLYRSVPVDTVSRGTGEASLYRNAWRNLANLLRAERRRRLSEGHYASERPQVIEACALPDQSAPSRRVRSRLLAVARDDVESKALALWLDGARAEAIAHELGLSHLSPAEQRREVKRFKDRIVKRALRVGRSARR